MMKIEKKFTPITITIETSEEFFYLKEMIRRASLPKRDLGGWSVGLRDDIEERALDLYKKLM